MLAAVVFVAGCGVAEATICTEIGCSPGLLIEFSGTIPEDFTVEVRTEGAVPFVVTCSASIPCGSKIFAAGIVGDAVEVIITQDGVPVTYSFMPEYEERRPNGPDCPPACLEATVQVAFP